MRVGKLRVSAAVAALSLACLCTAPARAGADEDAIKRVIRHQANALLKGDLADIKADFAEQASITDEVPPFYWQGPSSSVVETWWSDVGKELQKENVTIPRSHIDSFRLLMVDGDSAYAAADVVLTLKQGAETQREKGAWTFALVKRGQEWKIVSSAWAASIPKPVK